MRLRRKQLILEKLAQTVLTKQAVSVNALGRVAKLMRRSGLLVRQPQRAIPKLGGGYVKSAPTLHYSAKLDVSGIKPRPSPTEITARPAKGGRFKWPSLKNPFKRLAGSYQEARAARRRARVFPGTVRVHSLPKTLPEKALREARNYSRTAGDKVFASPGGAARLFKTIADDGSRLMKNLPPKTVKSVRRDTNIPSVYTGLRGSVTATKKNPEAQRAVNLWGLRHELSERGAAKRIKSMERLKGMGVGGYPRFKSHLSPGPMLNDLNIAATLTGPGASSTRNVIRDMRRGELSALISVLGTRFKSYQKGGAGYNWLNTAFKTGRRFNRREVRHLEDLYGQAATR